MGFNNSNNKWDFLFVPHERRSSGGEKIKKSFDDKAEAIKYYYLFQLHSYFFNHYVHPFQFNNKDINMGRPSFHLVNLKEAFRRLNMDPSYYSFDGKIKERSMFLETINNEESKVYFMGKDGEIVNTSLVLENWEAYDHMYQSVYYLYLFDQYYADLIKNKEIGNIFTDEDYKTLLTGR